MADELLKSRSPRYIKPESQTVTPGKSVIMPGIMVTN